VFVAKDGRILLFDALKSGSVFFPNDLEGQIGSGWGDSTIGQYRYIAILRLEFNTNSLVFE